MTGIKAHRGMRVSAAEFERLWSDPRLRLDDIAERLGITIQGVRSRARTRGLPARGHGRRHRSIVDPAFPRMWCAGVITADLMRLFGCAHTTPANTAARLGLPRRPRGWTGGITLSEWRQIEAVDRMRAAAEAERRALVRAEMVDGMAGRRAA